MPIQIYWKFYHQKMKIRRGGSNEYPQSMFSSKNKENNVYPCKPQFYYIKVGFKGVKIIQACFRDEDFFTCLHLFCNKSVINKHIIVVKNANVIRISSCAHIAFAVMNKHIIVVNLLML